MRLQLFILGAALLTSACQKNSQQSQLDSNSGKSPAALPIKGSFIAKDLYTSKVSLPLVRREIHLSGTQIDKDTTLLEVDISEIGVGTLSGQSRCKELGITTLNVGSAFVSELVLKRDGFVAGISPLARHADVSKCENDFGLRLVQSVRKVYPAQSAKGEALSRLTPDLEIPATRGLLPGSAATVNSECNKLYSRRMLRMSVANDDNTDPYQLNLEPLVCLGFRDKEMKQLRMILIHKPTGTTMIDYVAKASAAD